MMAAYLWSGEEALKRKRVGGFIVTGECVSL